MAKKELTTLRIGNKHLPQNRGLTFIELMLVAIILVVLAGLSLPFFRSPFSNLQLRDTCQRLTQLMRYVQAKSVAERRLCRINLDLEKGAFWPTIEGESSPGEFKQIEGRWAKTYKVAQGISIKCESPFFITFYPDGSSDRVKVEISNNRGQAFTILPQRTIGYVEVEE